ncbi:hypothetical protein GGR56DRAFT_140679 [Xylariaceae sp. FL0804]|nr:hypothetical protein GGR56DRAFT_140679 [Xylariaceae sp. FL0804]
MALRLAGTVPRLATPTTTTTIATAAGSNLLRRRQPLPPPLLRTPKIARLFHGSAAIRMSSAAAAPPPGQYEWLVVVPDKPGAHQKRLDVRPKHFEGLKPLLESGKLKTGGAVLSEKPDGDDATKFDFYGSTMVFVAASRAEVVETLRRDVYATSGVWDVDKAQIWPAKIAFRTP